MDLQIHRGAHFTFIQLGVYRVSIFSIGILAQPPEKIQPKGSERRRYRIILLLLQMTTSSMDEVFFGLKTEILPYLITPFSDKSPLIW